jgi:hypothetical protein
MDIKETNVDITGEGYTVTYEPAAAMISFQGILRLRGATEYAPIVEALDQLAAAAPPVITLDMRNLQFLNSFGINVIFRFVIEVRNRGASRLVVRGSAKVAWQDKSLRNLERLMPGLQLELDHA